MDDSALLLALIFGVIVLLLIVGALIARAGQRRASGAHDDPQHSTAPNPTGNEIHRDPDPERLAGGHASTHAH